MIAIINASPLIYLGKIGALKFIPKLFSQCYTTNLIKNEILSEKSAPEHTVLKESFSDWLIIKEPTNQKLKKKLEGLQIHPGEASIIALGKDFQDKVEENILIIDDLSAREIARTLDLKITGTVGIILKAMRLNIINKNECKNLLRILIESTSFRISAPLYSKILRKIDDFQSKSK